MKELNFEQNDIQKLGGLIAKWMEILNDNPDILYFNDYCKKNNYLNIKQISHLRKEQKDKLSRAGFKTFNVESKLCSYNGNNYAKALDDLLNIKPLFIECGCALNLVKLLALREFLGVELFNTTMLKFLKGRELIIDDNIKYLPICDIDLYYRSYTHNREVIPYNLNIGDTVYLLGVQNGYGFHPDIQENGYNLVYIGKNEHGDDLFRGFMSYSDIKLTYDGLKKIFIEKYNENLKYGDLKIIYKFKDTEGYPYGCQLTYQEIYDSLLKENKDNFDKEIAKALSRDTNQFELSKIKIPERYLITSIIGCVYISRINKENLNKFLHNKPVVLEPKYISVVDNRPSNSNIDEKFIQSENYQKELYFATNNFVDDCIERKNKFRSLIIYGDKGVGKTHCCKKAIEFLKSRNFKVCDVSNSDLEKVFNKFFDKINLFALYNNLSENNKVHILKDILSKKYKKLDVIYLDMDNLKLDNYQYTLLIKAFIIFAYLYNKKVLISGDIIELNKSIKNFLKIPFGDIDILEVRGKDFRKEMSNAHNLLMPQQDNRQCDARTAMLSQVASSTVSNENIKSNAPEISHNK